MGAGGLRGLPVPSPGDTKYRLREGALGGTRGLLPVLGGRTRAGSLSTHHLRESGQLKVYPPLPWPLGSPWLRDQQKDQATMSFR